jgi:multidrug efflux pump subunit AcrA (membrane-fusion protein)
MRTLCSALSAALLLTCFATAALLAGCHKPAAGKAGKAAEAEVPVTVVRLQVAALDRTIPVVGTLFAKDEATVRAEVEGQVEGTIAEFGDRLTNGQIIAQINTTTYLALSLQAEANVARARATLANAEQNRKRLHLLSQQKIASPSDLDQAVAAAERMTKRCARRKPTGACSCVGCPISTLWGCAGASDIVG